MRRSDLSELGEDFCLQVKDLGNCFDDHVDFGQGIHGGARSQAAAGCFGVTFRDALLGDILLQ